MLVPRGRDGGHEEEEDDTYRALSAARVADVNYFLSSSKDISTNPPFLTINRPPEEREMAWLGLQRCNPMVEAL